MLTINKSTIFGRLGANPEVNETKNGNPVVSFSVVTNESWKNENGDWQERSDWHNVVIFNKNLCNIAEKHLKKGDAVYIEAPLQTRSWEDKKTGTKMYKTELVVQGFNAVLKPLEYKKNDV
ncbi:MAG: hypothetical protein OFPII_43170 [Osedax symbiont Rs1]|nr:MAG: hypothetical protein OFPII_43170 [Osedax symbiont Rs1]